MTWEIDPDVGEREKERTEDDRATRDSIADFLSDGTGGGVVQGVSGDADSSKHGKRKLRATFRTTPTVASNTGLPGTRAFPAHGTHGRSSGAALESAGQRPVGSPAAAARTKHFTGWRAPVQQAGGAPSADKPAQPADASPAGGDVRGRGNGSGLRRGRPKKKQTQASSVEGNTKAITRPLPIGVRVSITDPTHPWTGHSGEIVSRPEKYGLGWHGQRIRLDGNAGESYVRPAQTNGTAVGGRGTASGAKSVTLPKDIAKLVGKVEPVTPRVIAPTETERSNATRLFREIGETFNENRKKSKTAAYAAYRRDLMANLDTLIMGGAIDLKEVTTVITNLEQYTKETEAESIETPATILGRWLRMDAAEIAGLEVPVEEAVEDEEYSGEEVDELDAAADPGNDGDSETVS